MSLITYLTLAFKYKGLVGDPLKDKRCKGCSHIDGLLCRYPLNIQEITSFKCNTMRL